MDLGQIIRAHPDRRSRLHTGRGDLIPIREVPAAFGSAMARRTQADRGRPWMTPAAVRRLEGLLTPAMTVLELGGGTSTAWFADRVGSIVTVEPVPKWADRIREMVGSRTNVEVVETDERSYAKAVTNDFDVIIVDNEPVDARPELVELLLPRCRHIMVHDDSDAEGNEIPAAMLAGWRVERHVGMKSHPLAVVETALYLRASS